MNVAHLQPVNDRLTMLWDAYVEAAKTAQESLHVEDGIRAGMAWKAFMDVFTADAQFRSTVAGGAPTTGI